MKRKFAISDTDKSFIKSVAVTFASCAQHNGLTYRIKGEERSN